MDHSPQVSSLREPGDDHGHDRLRVSTTVPRRPGSHSHSDPLSLAGPDGLCDLSGDPESPKLHVSAQNLGEGQSPLLPSGEGNDEADDRCLSF